MVSKTENVKYYYLNSSANQLANARSCFNSARLRYDLERGVTTLNEDAYTKVGTGATRFSLCFLVILAHFLPSEHLKGKKAKITFSNRSHFRLFVETSTGYLFRFDGIGSGYFGEGSRGAYDILRFFGFSHEQAERVFKNEQLTLYKRKVD